MGAATRKRQRFLKEHPLCAFCSGKAHATCIEHCPPRAMFQHKIWPEGLEFPSCEHCNHGTSNDDLIVSVLARMHPNEEVGDADRRLGGMLSSLERQFPGILSRMLPSATEARRSNRMLGIAPGVGQTHQDTGVAKLPPEAGAAVRTLARKLSKGIFYRYCNTIFPQSGCLLLSWFTNADYLRDGSFKALEVLKNLSGATFVPERNGKYLDGQFLCKMSTTPDREMFVLQAMFGLVFGIVVFGSSSEGLLERKLEELRTSSTSRGPLLVLQSPILGEDKR